jgi:hypothetical protein
MRVNPISDWNPDPMSLRAVLGILLVVNSYVLIYYRLLVKHYYEEQHGVKENTFGALFSFPPYRRLSEPGRKYARRYWVALLLLTLMLLAIVLNKEGSVWPTVSDSPAEQPPHDIVR